MRTALKLIAILQFRRFPWILMGGTALGLAMMGYSYFQKYLALEACEYCVYIRFSMYCVAAGALVTALIPSNLIIRIIFGYLITGYAIIQGFLWDFHLAKIYSALKKISEGGDFFAQGGNIGGCSLDPIFPLGLKLHVWFPDQFAPTGLCGGVDWTLLGLNMPQALMLFYIIYIPAFILMVFSCFIYMDMFKKGNNTHL